MKEDVLEQLVDDYLQARGYLTRHNLKFKPSKTHLEFDGRRDSNHSDIDVLGYHPLKSGPERVWVVSCKSWQTGLKIKRKLDELAKNKTVSGREAWMGFRELMKPKWSEGFLAMVEEVTGTRQFTYVTAVTKFHGDAELWEMHRPFRDAIGGNPIKLLSLSEMVCELTASLNRTPAASQLGRTLQLLKASGCNLAATM